MGRSPVTGLPKGFSAPVPLGAGGEARAVLGWQELPGRWAVIKVADPGGRSRLRRESELLSRLAGGPVPALLGHDLTARRPWVALTWIDGLPFDEIPGDLPVSDRRALILQASLAVARLHGANVVHGDLAPPNLIARPHGEVAIVDFGLSPSLDGSVPPVEGTWAILPPERIQGGAPDPRWDVFALGVLGLRILGAIPPNADSRESWTQWVASGDLAKWARGRSWGLSLALDPDPAQRPADAAALVRLLERDWGDPPFTRGLLQELSNARLDHLLERAVVDARSRKDWESAWRLVRERIERSASPEPLLAELGDLQRRKTAPRWRLWPFLGGVVAVVALASLWWWNRKPGDKPSELEPASAPVWRDDDDRIRLGAPDVLIFDPPPTGSILWVDDKELPVPRDGFLRLAPGTHRVELEDSTGESLLDTNWLVPSPTRRPAKPRPHPSTKGEK